ncbi:MAG: AraC family transcriptional regulator [Propionibacteriales bacterium]|nr:AraC family transcriptional regulator [Propionibacteriales bacterium]
MRPYRWMRFFTPDPCLADIGLWCLGLGVLHGQLPIVGPRTVDRHVIVVVRAGDGWFVGEDQQRQLVRGPALLMLRPGERHTYGPDPEVGWDEIFVAFDGPAVSRYQDSGFLPRRPVTALSLTAPLEAAFGRLLDTRGREIELAASLHELVLSVRQSLGDDVELAGHSVLEALSRDAFLDLTIEQHAARLGLSVRELRAVVQRVRGQTPKRYLLQVRLERASTLLSRTDLTTRAVARMCGFNDPAYFSRLFTRLIGRSPSAYRADAVT